MLISGLGATGLITLAACGGGPTGPTPPPGISVSPSPTPRRLLGVIPEPPLPSPTPTPPPAVLRFAHWETGAAARVLADACDRFVRATPRVVVQVVVEPFGLHFDHLRRGFASGTAADVFVSSGIYVADFLARHALLDLTNRLSLDQLKLGDYWTDPTTQPIDGRQYSLPIWNASEVVYYNRDHFAELKVAEPPETWTWDDLLTTAQQLTQGKPGEIRRWGLLLTNDLQGGWGSFVASNGGDWVDPSGHHSALQSPAALEALQWYADAMLVHHVAPRPTQQQALSRAGQIDPFLAGDVSLLPNGTWEMPAALAQASFRWDVRRLPRAPRTGQSVTISGVQPASASAATRLPDVSWELLRFLLAAEVQTMLAAKKIKLPSRKDVASSRSTGYASPPPTNALAAVQAMDDARYLRFVPGWQAFRNAVIDALDLAFDGRIPLADAVQQATNAGNAALASAPSG